MKIVKRRAAILVILCASLLEGGGGGPLYAEASRPAAAAEGNAQKIYPVESEIYQAIKALYIAAGLSLPSTTGPWSGSELSLMLSRLDESALSGAELAAYDWAASRLAAGHGVFKFNFTPTLELHAHTDTENFVTPDQYVRPLNETKPLLAFSTEAWFGRHFYVLGALDVGNKVMNDFVEAPNGEHYAGSSLFGHSAFSTNIWALPPSKGIEDIDWITPKRSFLSAGGSSWSFVIGRDRLSWGPGESGNFVVGDHIDYHDNARLTLFNKALKYTFNISSFQYPGEYFEAGWNPYDSDRTYNNVIGGVNFFVAHRFEFRALKDKLNFVITESAMTASSDGKINPEVLLPTSILHNIYRFEEMNSLLSLEADYALRPNLNIYGQFALDELAMPGDTTASATEDAVPNAFGFMLGAQTAFPLSGRLFSASLEAALTDPYLYLRSSGHGNQNEGEAGVNFVVANRETFDILYYEDFLGYRWGGDAIVANAHAGLRELGEWNAEANLLFMVHGTHDKWTTYQNVYADNDLGNEPVGNTTPTTSHPQANHADPDASERNAPYYLTALSLSGSWNVKNVAGLSVYGQADLVNVVNPGNIRGAPPVTDLQLTLGASYAF